jgi:L-alanine-DL-glutamate epimerase-like enolase superfamily enzyme
MARTITNVTAYDVRFPTSRHLDGSDAMNQAPDYSAAYALIETDAGDGQVGHGMTFTIGRGNEVCAKAIESLATLVVGRTLEDIIGNMGQFWRSLAGESQFRWIGPEKGAIHLATAAIVNGIWDLWAKVEGKPVWKLLIDATRMTSSAAFAATRSPRGGPTSRFPMRASHSRLRASGPCRLTWRPVRPTSLQSAASRTLHPIWPGSSPQLFPASC